MSVCWWHSNEAAKNRLPHQESSSSYQDEPFLAFPGWEQDASRFWYQEVLRLM